MAGILFAASGGGHLDQLALMVGAEHRAAAILATPATDQAALRGFSRIESLPDCNLRQPIRTLRCALVSLMVVMRHRPSRVVSTGAAPGLLCALWGRLGGARVLWVDSAANAEKLSLSGRIARVVAHNCLTQWPDLADGKRVQFAGSIL